MRQAVFSGHDASVLESGRDFHGEHRYIDMHFSLCYSAPVKCTRRKVRGSAAGRRAKTIKPCRVTKTGSPPGNGTADLPGGTRGSLEAETVVIQFPVNQGELTCIDALSFFSWLYPFLRVFSWLVPAWISLFPKPGPRTIRIISGIANAGSAISSISRSGKRTPTPMLLPAWAG